ncbi:hypothetical protein PAHAL_3G493100 [Panicum hallii]|uniref:Uncharacterized protein n=1 Tax=Panicum hallii TaxID=206008 RepID=A0A2T8KLZ3_9POAL|nr:hypothetical protein PAHAL_3G493100 [Panicum hallii]
MYNGYAITIPGRSPVYPSAPGRIQFAPSVAAPRTVPAPTCPRFKGRRARSSPACQQPPSPSSLLPPLTLPPHLLLPPIISSHKHHREGKRREREEGEGGSADLFQSAAKFSSEAGRTNSQVLVSSVLSLSISSSPFLFFSLVFLVSCTSFYLHESKRICYSIRTGELSPPLVHTFLLLLMASPCSSVSSMLIISCCLALQIQSELQRSSRACCVFRGMLAAAVV